MKKVYYYDYNQTTDSKSTSVQDVNAGTDTSVYQAPPEPTSSAPSAQDVNASDPDQTPPPPYTPPPHEVPYSPSPSYEVRRSNIIPLVLGTLAVFILAAIIWAFIPKNYDECVTFPGSSTSTTFPPTCSTFYGANFTGEATPLGTEGPTIEPQAPDDDLTALLENDTPINTITPFPTSALLGATSQTTPTPAPTIVPTPTTATTKGGQPVEPTPTPKPTTAPAKPIKPAEPVITTDKDNYVHPASKLVLHTYPTQKLQFDLPSNYHGTAATHEVHKGLTTFHVYAQSPSNPILTFTVKSNWSGWEGAKNNPIAFVLSDVNVMLLKSSASQSYYFTKSGLVYKATCFHHDSDKAASFCEEVIRSIKFI